MKREEAEEYAKNMTYHDAVYNALQGKCVPYRKATLIKLYELLDRLEQEPLTDAEQRIFLAAMVSEEKFCRKFCADGYLVRVCREIKRKVKKALWE